MLTKSYQSYRAVPKTTTHTPTTNHEPSQTITAHCTAPCRALHEVIGPPGLAGTSPGIRWRRIENVEPLRVLVLHLANAGNVPAAVAVIGCAPDRYQLVVEHGLVSLHDQLVRPGNEIEAVSVVEFGHNVRAKEVAGPPGGNPPAVDFFRIAPHEIADGSLVGDLLPRIQVAYLIERVDAGGQSGVHREYAVVDDRAQAEVVKDLRAVLPDVDGLVLAEAFVVKAVDLGDLSALVVPADERHALGIPDLEGQEQQKGFHAVVAPVHKVSQKNVVDVRAFAPHPKEFQQIVELAVNVSDDRYGRRNFQDIGFLR
mmetsp:Transcript_21021/g.45841  ORF Transcript_21021/g.45841 Transcript_21021/m.45841 type:complete len:313 (+) Transcript_21021:273-1211(+)